jgi:PAS domain S-box-containing protein
MFDKIFHQNKFSDSELLLLQIWDLSVDGMRLTNEDGLIVMVNPAYCKMVNKSYEELLQKPFQNVYHPSCREEVLNTYKQDIELIRTKTHFECERTLWNGIKAWFEFSNSFIVLPEAGKLTLSIIKEITKRKQAEVDLLKSEEKYRMLFNNAHDAIFVFQLSEGRSYGDFIEVNDVACKRLGYSKEEFLKLSPSALIPPKHIERYNHIMEKLPEVKHVIYEMVHLAKDRRLINVEISSHLFEFNEKPTILSIARDITERKISEDKLKKTSRRLRNLASHLQSIREEERTIIAREIHDELGQVLTALKIQILLLEKKLREDQQPLKDKVKEVTAVIDSTIESVQRIASKLRPVILDELGLISAIDWQAQDFEKSTGIKCEFNSNTEDLPLEKESSTAVFRILQEALTNVARHAEATSVSINVRKLPDVLSITIIDDGKGITDHQVNDVKSLGILGMKERALLIGGNVTIERRYESGTLVSLEMPLKKN